jgi:hypothetical protein
MSARSTCSLGLGWLAPTHHDQWRQGWVQCLERVMQASLPKLSTAMGVFRRWAQQRGLVPSETGYLARTRGRSRCASASVERPRLSARITRTGFRPSSPQPSATDFAQRQSRPPDLVVISPLKDWTCTTCSGTGDLLIMQDVDPVCLRCADLNHLVFLPAGDAGLTRRAHRTSELSAVVVRFSRTAMKGKDCSAKAPRWPTRSRAAPEPISGPFGTHSPGHDHESHVMAPFCWPIGSWRRRPGYGGATARA